MKVGFFGLERWEIAYLKKKRELRPFQTSFYEQELTEGNAGLAAGLDAAAVFIYSRMNREVLAKCGRLLHIATMSTGFDHIDLKECKRRKISVSNVPLYGDNTVAEHTFALILALSRKIHKAYQRTLVGEFSLEGLMGFDLKGKTIGVVGTGHIGRHVVRIARGFEMNILVYDKYPSRELEIEMGASYVSLDRLLRESDIVTIHCPLTQETRHLINEKNIMGMRRGALLINTARGPIVSTHALVRALEAGVLGGAGLDVLEEESIVKEETQILSKSFDLENLRTVLTNHILIRHPNVIVTPHVAFYSREALLRILDTTVENICGFVAGRPKNLVLASRAR